MPYKIIPRYGIGGNHAPDGRMQTCDVPGMIYQQQLLILLTHHIPLVYTRSPGEGR